MEGLQAEGTQSVGNPGVGLSSARETRAGCSEQKEVSRRGGNGGGVPRWMSDRPPKPSKYTPNKPLSSCPHHDIISTPLPVLGPLISKSFPFLLSKGGPIFLMVWTAMAQPWPLWHNPGRYGTTPVTTVSSDLLASSLVYNRKSLKPLSN